MRAQLSPSACEYKGEYFRSPPYTCALRVASIPPTHPAYSLLGFRGPKQMSFPPTPLRQKGELRYRSAKVRQQGNGFGIASRTVVGKTHEKGLGLASRWICCGHTPTMQWIGYRSRTFVWGAPGGKETGSKQTARELAGELLPEGLGCLRQLREASRAGGACRGCPGNPRPDSRPGGISGARGDSLESKGAENRVIPFYQLR